MNISVLKIGALFYTLIFCILPVFFIPTLYDKMVETSWISEPCRLDSLSQSVEAPIWFVCNDTIVATNKTLDNEDMLVLRRLVSDTIAVHAEYMQAICRLAYKSKTWSDNSFYLLWLTLCFVELGCSARTLFDYIGWECYKKGQDMKKWWPWYIYRPLMGAPIAAFLLVTVRTSFFPNLFTARDLNTYFVVAFLAGFALMDFLKMLRRVSKAMFANEE